MQYFQLSKRKMASAVMWEKDLSSLVHLNYWSKGQLCVVLS
jgi:hypothetical protein